MSAEKCVNNQPAPWQDDDEIDLLDLFSALWKQKWVIVFCLAAFIIAGASYALVTPKTYEARTTLLILPPISRELAEPKSSGGQMFSSEIYMDLALAQDLLNDVISEVYPGTDRPNASGIKGRMSVSVNKASEKDATGKLPFTLSVSLKGGEPADLTSFLTSWITQFTRRNSQLFSIRGTQSFEYVRENLETVKKDLKAVEETLADYRKQNPPGLLENQLSILKTLHGIFQEELAVKTRALVALEEELKTQKDLLSGEPQKLKLYRAPSDEALWNFRMNRDNTEKTQSPNSFGIYDEVLNTIHFDLRGKIMDAEAKIASIKASLTDIKENLQATEKEYNEKHALFVESAKIIKQLEREEKALTNAYNDLANKFQETRIAAAEAADPIRVVEHPVLPVSPVAPKKTLIVALSGVLGGFIGIFAALIVNMVKNRRSLAEVEG
ncbi:MAG: GumC family protein [Aminivibrio sp.]|jgi:succinoglycan biosynthesis transport protein ExoP